MKTISLTCILITDYDRGALITRHDQFAVWRESTAVHRFTVPSELQQLFCWLSVHFPHLHVHSSSICTVYNAIDLYLRSGIVCFEIQRFKCHVIKFVVHGPSDNSTNTMKIYMWLINHHSTSSHEQEIWRSMEVFSVFMSTTSNTLIRDEQQ